MMTSLRVDLASGRSVSALLEKPSRARALLVLAHGAGAGMKQAFLQAIAEGFAKRAIATLRFQFPYMEEGSRRPDAPKLAQETVRAAVRAAQGLAEGLPLFAGGKSFGGRMTSQAQAAEPLPGVRGLVFLGFPLHPTGHPSQERAQHLFEVKVPMLFLQGTRDALADLALLRPIVERLGPAAALEVFDGADHSFHVRASTGRKDADVLADLLERAARWITKGLE